jgi:mRNA interferase HigB
MRLFFARVGTPMAGESGRKLGRKRGLSVGTIGRLHERLGISAEVPWSKAILPTTLATRGIKAARSQYDAWLDIVVRAEWHNPEDVKASYPKASILKASRVVFNIKGNDYRLVAALQYRAGAVAIRFFGTHSEHDRIDAETV